MNKISKALSVILVFSLVAVAWAVVPNCFIDDCNNSPGHSDALVITRKNIASSQDALTSTSISNCESAGTSAYTQKAQAEECSWITCETCDDNMIEGEAEFGSGESREGDANEQYGQAETLYDNANFDPDNDNTNNQAYHDYLDADDKFISARAAALLGHTDYDNAYDYYDAVLNHQQYHCGTCGGYPCECEEE